MLVKGILDESLRTTSIPLLFAQCETNIIWWAPGLTPLDMGHNTYRVSKQSDRDVMFDPDFNKYRRYWFILIAFWIYWILNVEWVSHKLLKYMYHYHIIKCPWRGYRRLNLTYYCNCMCFKIATAFPTTLQTAQIWTFFFNVYLIIRDFDRLDFPISDIFPAWPMGSREMFLSLQWLWVILKSIIYESPSFCWLNH